MPRLAFKSDSSFFRTIAMGAVGARAVIADLSRFGHRVVELERGSADTKLWKDIKRKRVRIPDLVCTACGTRIESRAKTKPDLSLSHSLADDSRVWDYGMVDEDWIAFPICEAQIEEQWSAGRLKRGTSYWHERSLHRWVTRSHVNYFQVRAFRATAPVRSSVKGVTEGSETSLTWGATFSNASGVVESVSAERVTVCRSGDGRRSTRRIPLGQTVCVEPGVTVIPGQVIASSVSPIPPGAYSCRRSLNSEHLARLLNSRERTQRFTGIKLARLLEVGELSADIRSLAGDPEEDVYVRLEAAAYLASACGYGVADLFSPYVEGSDPQTQLEAVISLGEVHSSDATEFLATLLESVERPYFIRSAAAWCLSRIGTPRAVDILIRAFADLDLAIREEALEGIACIGALALPDLVNGVLGDDGDIAAGCAESLRQQSSLPEQALTLLAQNLGSKEPSPWAVWLLGNLPRDQVAARISALQSSAPELHYAVSILWCFIESWVARRWELHPRPFLEI